MVLYGIDDYYSNDCCDGDTGRSDRLHSDLLTRVTYAKPSAKHAVMPILSETLIFRCQMLYMGNAMITRSVKMLVVIMDLYIAIWSPQCPLLESKSHCAEIG